MENLHKDDLLILGMNLNGEMSQVDMRKLKDIMEDNTDISDKAISEIINSKAYNYNGDSINYDLELTMSFLEQEKISNNSLENIFFKVEDMDQCFFVRKSILEKENLSSEFLDSIVKNQSIDNGYKLIAYNNPNISNESKEELLKNKDFSKLIELLNNTETTYDELNSKISMITKSAIVNDSNTSPYVLDLLSKNLFSRINDMDTFLENFVENPNCPKKVLEECAKSKDFYKTSMIINHPNIDDNILKILISKNNNEDKIRIIKSENVSTEILTILSNDKDKKVFELSNKKLNFNINDLHYESIKIDTKDNSKQEDLKTKSSNHHKH